MSITFKDLSDMIENFGCEHLSYWGNALAGEVGEVCNLVKKMERDQVDLSPEILEELADVFIYLVLLARQFPHLELEKAILDKLEIIKERQKKKEVN